MPKRTESDVGQRIFMLRQDRGMSREKLAELSEVSARFLYEIEMNGVGFSASVLERLSRALDVSADYILFGRLTSISDDVISDTIGKFEPTKLRQVEELLNIIYDMVHSS